VKTIKSSEKLQSNVIDALRFPLIIGVLFIHNYSSTVTIPGTIYGNESYMPVYHVCSQLCSQILGRVSVPLFFFISGFLFFLNVKFDKKCYKQKLKKRFKSLLIPYLFWNIITLLYYLILSAIPQLNTFLNNKVEFTFPYMLKSLWASYAYMPISYQFWFIRDLMVVTVLTPIIYFVVKKIHTWGILFFGVLWLFGWWFKISGLSIVSIFFFSFGAWFSINQRNLIDEMEKFRFLSYSYPVFVIIDLLTEHYAINAIIHNIGIIIGLCFVFNIVSYLLREKKIAVNKYLSTASFFVFCFHEPLLISIKKTLFLLFQPNEELFLVILYFLNVIIVIFIALILYCFLNRFSPGFLKFITGRNI
jgi:fucose 4-O-acetylase-like acetyltransferase